MSKSNNRGSLIGLKSSLPALPKANPVPLTAEMEQRILGRSGESSLHTDVSIDLPSPRAAAPAITKKEPTVLMNAKLPVRLHARLKRTAQFNDISMTEILIRAIEVELASGNYTAPPETWGSESF